MIPVTSFAGKTVAVFGLGGSGLASCHALKAGGADVALNLVSPTLLPALEPQVDEIAHFVLMANVGGATAACVM